MCGVGVWLLPRLTTRLLLVGVPLLSSSSWAGRGSCSFRKAFGEGRLPCLACRAAALVVAHRLTASEKETRDVAAEKVENQKLLGLSFQEKGMLDMALATFNKLPFTEDMKLVYVNLGLDYENRGQRDKAFLVHKKVFDADPGFENVAQRIERLGQAGVGEPVRAPTAQMTAYPRRRADPGARRCRRDQPPTWATDPTMPRSGHELSPTAARTRTSRGGAPASPRMAPAPPPRPMPPTVVVSAAPTPPRSRAARRSGARLGRYEVERHLGRGDMGDVYLVRDTVINRTAALKTIRLDRTSTPRRPSSCGALLPGGPDRRHVTHPNIVTVYDVGKSSACPTSSWSSSRDRRSPSG